MTGLQLDPARMAAIADGLCKELPNVPPEAQRHMIDAAGELRRLVDQARALLAQRAKDLQKLKEIVARECNCDACRAERAGKPTPGSLN